MFLIAVSLGVLSYVWSALIVIMTLTDDSDFAVIERFSNFGIDRNYFNYVNSQLRNMC